MELRGADLSEKAKGGPGDRLVLQRAIVPAIGALRGQVSRNLEYRERHVIPVFSPARFFSKRRLSSNDARSRPALVDGVVSLTGFA